MKIYDRPEPGYFALRTVARMPWVPALICAPCPFVSPDEKDWPYHTNDWCYPLDRQPYPLCAKIGESLFWDSDTVSRVWTWGNSIDAQAYAFLMSRRAYARKWFPSSFEAHPITTRNLRRY